MKKLLSILLAFTLAFPFTMSADNVTIRIKAMRCEECAHKVGKALNAHQGINSLDFNLERRTVTVDYDPALISTDSINAILKKTGRYQPSVYNPNDVIRKAMGLQVEEMQSMDDLIRIMNNLYKVEGMDSVVPHLEQHWVFVRYDANRTDRATIISSLMKGGFTPVAHYTDSRISHAYFKFSPAGVDAEGTADEVLALDGVDDVCYNPQLGSLAITYLNDQISKEKLEEEVNQLLK